MLYVLIVLAFFGFCFAGGALLMALFKVGEVRALWRLRRTPLTPLAAWPGATGRVAAEAVTEYGDAGRQLAPVSGEDCAWYHVELLREPARGFRSSDDPDYDVLLDHTTPGWPAVADRTGRVPVDPRVFTAADTSALVRTRLQHRRSRPVPLPPVVTPAVLADLRKGERLTLTEERLPRGTEVYVMARMTRRGALAPLRGERTFLTPGRRAGVLERTRADSRTVSQAVVAFALIGVVLFGGSFAALSALYD